MLLVATMASLKTSHFCNLVQIKEDKKSVGSTDINATFADLPAPELKWEEMAEAPVARLDGAAIQIKNLLYVFAGYGTINHVRNLPDIFHYPIPSCFVFQDIYFSTLYIWSSYTLLHMMISLYILEGIIEKVFVTVDLNDSSR
jgi:hypothetical protein